MRTITLTLEVTAPDYINNEEVVRLVNRVISEGYNAAMECPDDIEDDDIGPLQDMDIGDVHDFKQIS